MSATRDASAIVAVRPWPNRAACEPRGEPRAPSRPARPSHGCRRHRAGDRAQPRQPHGIPLPHLGRPPPSAAGRPPAPTSAAATSPTPWRPAAAPTVPRCRPTAVSLGIVTSYNDMLSAHAPFEHYPQEIKETARDRGCRPGRRRRARHVRRHHPGPGGHGAQPVQPRRHRDVDRDRPVPRRLRRRPDARRLRQDRARPRRRCPGVRAPAHRAGAGRPDVLGALERREGRGP